MSATPRVSVGLPVYNGEEFLEETLQSLLAQDMGAFELVISDNASEDATEEICRSYADKDPRIAYHRAETNRGAAWNYNQVFHLSSADYFKWAPHDDLYSPNALGACARVLDESPPDTILAYPSTVLVTAAGEIEREFEDRLDIPHETPHERLGQFTRWYGLCNPVLGMMRRSALAKTRLIDSFSGSDVVLLAELAMLGKWREVSEARFYRRRHPGASRTSGRSAREVLEWFDTSAGKGLVMPPKLRLVQEHLVSISRSGLGPVEKTRCATTYLSMYFYKRTRVNMGRLRRRIAGAGT